MRLIVCVAAAASLAAFPSGPAFAGSRTITISKRSFHGTWPFTVSKGRLSCKSHGRGIGEVTFRARGRTYGLNGLALQAGFPRPNPIWKRAGYGLRVNIGDVLERGLALC
ncbi:MAG: hypothetical protein QOG35_1115 [Solirubrobacteraceae bacterium]|jgi:hypothetical protein|nr:hypothetical protein [Solirubrobacteraceae bacterium]